MRNVVLLKGHVRRPGGYQWRDGMRITDLVSSAEALLPRPDLGYAVVRREVPPTMRVKALSVELGKAFASPGGAEDIELEPRDTVLVFSGEIEPEEDEREGSQRRSRENDGRGSDGFTDRGGSRRLVWQQAPRNELEAFRDQGPVTDAGRERFTQGQQPTDGARDFGRGFRELEPRGALPDERLSREELLAPLLDELRAQARKGQPEQVVSVRGHVLHPGEYPLESDMMLDDLIRAGGAIPAMAIAVQTQSRRRE